MPSQENNKRIAKNTLMLYIRMLFALAVGLYTSRIILQILGVEDFGIYTIVGGVVGLLAFLNSTMSSATSRFLTYELGKGNQDWLHKTFNSALIVHIGISLIVFIILETIGLWFLCNKIVIPNGRMDAALWAYQFFIFSSIINVTQVPYNASIISHEKLDVYAYVEILHVLLKLGIVYLLFLGSFDKLKLYATLFFFVNLTIAIIYRVYCIRNFKECKFQLQTNKKIIKGILSFSIYNLLGNLGVVMNRQGMNILINIFHGVVYNASSGLATTVADYIATFAHNVITAFRPPMTKAYATNNIKELESNTSMALQLSIFMLAMIATPAMIEINYILKTWLGDIPDKMEIFTKLIIISIMFEIIKYIFIIDIHATGNVKKSSIATFIILSLNPLLIYIVFGYYNDVTLAFKCNVFAQFVLAVIIIVITKKQIKELNVLNLVMKLCKLLAIIIVSYYFTLYFSMHIKPSFLRILYTTLISSLLLSSLTYSICINRIQKKKIMKYIHKRLHILNI